MGAFNAKYPSSANSVASTGDIYGLTNLQWQKVINSYRSFILISLSKRAADPAASDIGIATQFATIVNNPATYPVMTSNADNLVFKFNAAYKLSGIPSVPTAFSLTVSLQMLAARSSI